MTKVKTLVVKKMKINLKKLSLTVCLVITLFLFAIQDSAIIPQSAVEFDNSELPKLNSDPVIIIDEDSDFLTYPGYGNETHPYLIEGFDIKREDLRPIGAPLNCCIIVANTTKHFVIQNNSVFRGYSGIRIESVAPGTAKIINNNAEANMHGIYMINVTGAIIEDNYAYRMKIHTGITLENCHDCNITNNIIEDLPFDVFQYPNILCDGIRIFGCTGINIINNELYYCQEEAINIISSSDILLQTNYIHDCDHIVPEEDFSGVITLTSTTSSIIYNNTVSHNRQWANIHTYLCDDILINKNTLSESERMGIYLKTTTNSNITWNTISNHPKHGVSIWQGGGNNIIHHNTFQDNNPDGTSQGADYSSNNVWYDTATNEGNWWSDWAGGDYRIDGTSDSVDPHPLGTYITVSEFSIKIGMLFITVPVIACITLISIKKKRK